MNKNTKRVIAGVSSAVILGLITLAMTGCPQPTDSGPTDEEKLATLKANATTWAHSVKFSFNDGLDDMNVTYNGTGINEIPSFAKKAIDGAIAGISLSSDVQLIVVNALAASLQISPSEISVSSNFTNTVSASRTLPPKPGDAMVLATQGCQML